MSESFSVKSSLTIETNVNSVINKLIEEFDRFDRRIKETQEALTTFAQETADAGKSGGALNKAFAELKLPAGLLKDIESIVGLTKSLATESTNASKAWKEMASSARSMRNVQQPGSDGGGRGGRGGGGGGGRGGSGGGMPPFGDWDDYQKAWKEHNAREQAKDPNFNLNLPAQAATEQKLMLAEQQKVIKEIADRKKAEAAQNAQDISLLHTAYDELANVLKGQAKQAAGHTKVLDNLAKAESSAVADNVSELKKIAVANANMERQLGRDERHKVISQIAERERVEAEQTSRDLKLLHDAHAELAKVLQEQTRQIASHTRIESSLAEQQRKAVADNVAELKRIGAANAKMEQGLGTDERKLVLSRIVERERVEAEQRKQDSDLLHAAFGDFAKVLQDSARQLSAFNKEDDSLAKQRSDASKAAIAELRKIGDTNAKMEQGFGIDERKLVISKIAERARVEQEQAELERDLGQQERASVLARISYRQKADAEQAKLEQDLGQQERAAVQFRITAREKADQEAIADARKAIGERLNAELASIKASASLTGDKPASLVAIMEVRQRAEADREKLEMDGVNAEHAAILASVSRRQARDAERDRVERELLQAEREAVQQSIELGRQKRQGTPVKMELRRGEQYGPPTKDVWQEQKDKEDAQFAAAQKKYDTQRATEGRRSHHDALQGAMGLQMLGEPGVNLAEKSVMSSFEVGKLESIITADTRLTDADKKQIFSSIQAAQAAVPGSTRATATEVFTDLKNVFGDTKDALAELQPFLRMVTTLQMSSVAHGGTGDIHQALNLARFIEDQGGAVDLKTEKYDPKVFDEIANRAVAIYIATQGRVAPREMLAFQKTGRTAGMMMSDHALYEETPFFIQGQGASKLGTQLFSEVQVMLANKATPKTLAALEDYGLYGGMKAVKKGKKTVMEPDQSTLKDTQLLREDPYKWIHDVLGGAIAKKEGIDTATKEGQEQLMTKVSELAQRGTIAGLWADVIRNYHTAQKEGANITAVYQDAQGHPQDVLKHFIETNPMAQLQVYHAAMNEFMVTLGDLLKGPALQVLKDLTAGLNGLSQWLKDNPQLGGQIATVAAGLSFLSSGLGTFMLTFAMIAPAVGLLKTVGISIGTLGGVLTNLAQAVVPFGEAGAARAALGGLATGLTLLASSLTAAYIALHPTATVAQKDEDKLIGKGNLDPHRFDNFGSPAVDDHGGGIMGYFRRLFDPSSYYHDPKFTADAYNTSMAVQRQVELQGPRTSIAGKSMSDPLYVVVMNQISEAGIARGAASHIASSMNRPSSGYTGGDTRMDTTTYWAGMIGP